MNAQAQEALAKANETRLVISVVRKDLGKLDRRAGFQAAANILVDEHDYETEAVEAMRFEKLLGSIRRVGPSYATAVAKQAGITNVNRRLRDLTNRQRVAAAEALLNPETVWPHTGRTREGVTP